MRVGRSEYDTLRVTTDLDSGRYVDVRARLTFARARIPSAIPVGTFEELVVQAYGRVQVLGVGAGVRWVRVSTLGGACESSSKSRGWGHWQRGHKVLAHVDRSRTWRMPLPMWWYKPYVMSATLEPLTSYASRTSATARPISA